MQLRGSSRLISAVAVAALAACGKGASPVDDGLKRDLDAVNGTGSSLELAPKNASSQVVVSAIESAPQAAPTRAPKVSAPKPVTRVAAPKVNTPAPAPAVHEQRSQTSVVAESPAPAPRRNSERAADPAPLPDQPSNRERQRGTYSTEAEIFQRMPWIRP